MNNPITPIKPIDIKALFYDKNQKLARWIPSFVFNYLKRVICQDRINEFIKRYGHCYGLDFSDGILEFLEVKFNVEGEDIIQNLPEDEKYIFVANHPLGGPDGIILISFLGKYFKKLKFPVNDLLLKLRNLNSIFLPVNKHGAQARSAALAMEQAYESDAQMIMFPAGLVSRKNKGVIKDLQWQKSFVSKAIQHKRKVIPVFIGGKNSNFFYNLANFRKSIGLKANIEMLFLVDETFQKQGQTFDIKFGKPIDWQELNNGEKPQLWANRIKEIVYDLDK